MNDSNRRNQHDLEDAGIIRTQKVHQVTIEQGSKNAAGKRAEIGDNNANKAPNKVITAQEEIASNERVVKVEDESAVQQKSAEVAPEAGLGAESKLAAQDEVKGGEHKEKAAETSGSSEHREQAPEASGASEHREQAEETQAAGANRVKLDPAQAGELEQGPVAGAAVLGSNFQAASDAVSSHGRVLAPGEATSGARDWDLAGAGESDASPKEVPAQADVENELDEIDVVAELEALAEGVEEPTAEFYEQMDFPARVIHLHIENEKVQAQIQELEKPWEKV